MNFGEPIQLNNYLNQHFPDWKQEADEARPKWLNPAVDKVANEVMVNINKAAALNAKNLIGSILLASRQRALSREQLLEQINSVLELVKAVPYSDDITIPNDDAETMLNHVLTLPRAGVITQKDSFGEMISLEREAAVLMNY